MFETVESRGVDQILALMLAFRADTRDQKIDLVVGVYKDEAGYVPVMRAVKAAERRLVEEEATKMYVGMSGDAEYCTHAQLLLLGKDAPQIADGRVMTFQTPGGSGALKVACDFLNSLEPGKRLWVSDPTWANHIPVAEDAGLKTVAYPYFRPSDRGLDFEAMMNCLAAEAKPGDAILLHGCCHNPTGVDLSLAQWETVTDFVLDRGLIPLVDCAYQGLGEGMEEDVAGLRYMMSRLPEMLIASSFSKNFGIYRERTGALTAIARHADEKSTVQAAIETVVRSNYSMPPSHGARVVATVFSDPELYADWDAELTGMRERIATMRELLKQKLEERQVTADVSFLTEQKGMFSYTGLTVDQIERLKSDFGIYVALDGRINIAGLSAENLDAVADGFAAVMR